MPTLDWTGKQDAIEIAKRITYRLLEYDSEMSCGDGNNLIVQGDNLDALNSLLPFYRGRVKCVYIDPPYNTGSAFEHYDDNLEHATWLSMMYPRLELLREFLSDDGAIFISIDDNEQAHLKLICDEIFGVQNFLIQMPRVTKRSSKSTNIFAKNHDELLVYSKSANYRLNPLKHNDAGFKYRDEFFDERGLYKLNQTLDYDSLQYSASLDYPLTIEGVTYYAGSSKENYLKRQTGEYKRADWAWRWSREKFDFGLANGFIVIKGKRIYTKTYQRATIDGTGGNYSIKYAERTAPVSSLALTSNEFSNDNATKVLTSVFGEKVFDYSKPVALIEFILRLATDADSIVLDAFAGSGTTAHAVINLNAQDGGNRKFILIEAKDYCRTITAERVKRVGGSFRFYRLGATLFDDKGSINPNMTFQDRTAYIWSKSTKTPYTPNDTDSPLIGIHDGTAYYVFNEVLTAELLKTLPPYDGAKIIFATACRISAEILESLGITFQQIPTEIR